jgi:hypothetical protein
MGKEGQVRSRTILSTTLSAKNQLNIQLYAVRLNHNTRSILELAQEAYLVGSMVDRAFVSQ